jgi:undecaprenyl-diphosphatase
MIDWLRHCDRELFLLINSHHNATFDWIMWHVSVPLTSLPIYLYILFRVFKKYPRKTVWYAVLTILVSVGLSNFISSEILKTTVHRLRPSHVPELQSYIHLVRNYAGGMYGFASSHAANMMAIAICTHFLLRKPILSIVVILWALLVSYSRIYLGVHYPGDVFAGIVIGCCVSLLCFTLFRIVLQRKQ